MFSNYLLSLAIWIPIAAGVLVLATGKDSRAPLARVLAFMGALAGFLVTLPLFTGFDRLSGGYQFTEFHEWIPLLKINYALGVDGISVLFIILNAFITLLVVLAGWEVIQKRPAQYMAAFLMMSGLINGAFAAQDAILFLCVLRGYADSAVPDYRCMGRASPRLCVGQAVPLYADGFALDAGCHGLPVLSNRQLLYCRFPKHQTDSVGRTTAFVCGVLPVIRCKSADVPCAHLVAGCPR